MRNEADTKDSSGLIRDGIPLTRGSGTTATLQTIYNAVAFRHPGIEFQPDLSRKNSTFVRRLFDQLGAQVELQGFARGGFCENDFIEFNGTDEFFVGTLPPFLSCTAHKSPLHGIWLVEGKQAIPSRAVLFPHGFVCSRPIRYLAVGSYRSRCIFFTAPRQCGCQ